VFKELTSRVFTQDKMRDKKTLRTREGGGFLRAVLVEFFTVLLCDAFVRQFRAFFLGLVQELAMSLYKIFFSDVLTKLRT